MLNSLRLNALRRAVVCTAWACVWLAQACTVMRLWAADKAEQRLDWVRTVQLALICSVVATFLACARLAFTPHALPGMDDLRRVSASGPSAAGLAPMTQQPAPGFLVCETLRLLLHVSLSYHPAVPAGPSTCVPPNINILMLEVVCTMRASFVGLDPKQHALAWAFTPFFWFLDYRYASLNALPGCATFLGHALRRGLLLVASKAFFTGLPVLLLSRDSKSHPCIAASVCLVLLGIQAATSGWRILYSRRTAVGLWEVWLAHMVAFGVGADEGNSVGEMHMQVRKVQRIAEDALPWHVVESLMQEPAAAMPCTSGSPTHSHRLELLSDYEHLVHQQKEGHGHLQHPHHHHHHPHHHQQHEHHHSGQHRHSGERAQHLHHTEQQQRQHALPGVQEEPQRGWFETWLPSNLSLTNLPSQAAASQASPVRSAASTPGARGLTLLGQGDSGQGGRRGSGASSAGGASGPSLRSSGESSAPYYPAGAIGRMSLTGASSPMAPHVPPRVSLGSTSSPTRSHQGLSHRCSDMSDSATFAEDHPNACVLFADIVSYTVISAATSPIAMVNLLNTLFRKFDQVVAEEPHLYKLDMVGDCYMVASGLHWHGNDPYPARTLVDFAKFLLHLTATVLNPVTGEPLQMRVGIHKGPAVGALLGRLRRKYTLLGDTVNAASRLESTCPRPGAIHISAAVHEELLACARMCARQEQQEAAEGGARQGQWEEQREQQQREQHQEQAKRHHRLKYTQQERLQQRAGSCSYTSDLGRSVTPLDLPQALSDPAAACPQLHKATGCADTRHPPHTSSSFQLFTSQHLTADTLGALTGSSGTEPIVLSSDSFEGFGFGVQHGGRSRRESQVSQYSARLNLPPVAVHATPGADEAGSSGLPGPSGSSSVVRGRSSLENPSLGGSVVSAQLGQGRHSQNLDNADVFDDVVTVWSPHSRIGSGEGMLPPVSLQGSFDAEAAETSTAEAAVPPVLGAHALDADAPAAPAHRRQAHLDDERATLPGLEAWQYCGETELKGRVATLETYVLQVV